MSVNISAEGRRTVLAKVEWRPRPDGMEGALVFQPGYNSDHVDDPWKNFGVHGMEIMWLLRGPKGAADVTFSTEWIPGELSPGHGRAPVGYPVLEPDQYPRGCGIGYHALAPQYDDQDGRDSCTLLPGGFCYWDVSYMASDEVAKDFTEHGEPAVWAALQARYDALTNVP